MAEKPPIVDLYRNLAELMFEVEGDEASALQKLTGPFPSDFLVTANAVLLQSNEHKIVKLSTKHDVTSAVLQFTTKQLFNLGEGYKWTGEQAESFVKYWTYLFPAIPMPKSWAWPGEDCYAFHRVPFIPEPGATPLWDELLGRMDNAAAFQLWFGSLFFEQADRQTYVWLYGEGQNGKGAILRALERVFGPAYKAEQVPADADKFWSYWLLGKRVVAFGDTNNTKFVASGNFKSLTGGDSVRMEIKGGASFCGQLKAMFIFASNERPHLSSEKADMRRAILCELGPIVGEPQIGYEEALWDELPAFVARCMGLYEARGFGPILADQEALEDWVGSLEDRYQAIIDDHMAIVPLDPALRQHQQAYTKATQMTTFLNLVLKGRETVEFTRYLERKHKIKRKRVEFPDGSGDHRYVGVIIRAPWEFNLKST